MFKIMFKTRNGWTKEKMIEQIQINMLDHMSANPGGFYGPACAYRASDGNKCAVGVFIPEKAYRIGMEGTRLFGFWTEVKEYMPLDSSGMDALQRLHDSSPEVDPRPLLIMWINRNVTDSECELTCD